MHARVAELQPQLRLRRRLASEDRVLRNPGAATAAESRPRTDHVLQRRADRRDLATGQQHPAPRKSAPRAVAVAHLSATSSGIARENTLVAAGVFYTDVDSYTFTRIGTDPTAPDSDGIVRLGAQTQDIAQGEGASYYGLEFVLPGTHSTSCRDSSATPASNVELHLHAEPGRPGRRDRQKIILADGDDAPFNGTAENQMNLVLFYQDAKFQARVAANYLSKQYQGTFSHWSFTAPNAGSPSGRTTRLFIDAGASYRLQRTLPGVPAGLEPDRRGADNYVQWPAAAPELEPVRTGHQRRCAGEVLDSSGSPSTLELAGQLWLPRLLLEARRQWPTIV